MVKQQQVLEPVVRVTRYDVSCLPHDHIDAPYFTLQVEYRGDGRWAVTRHGYCYNAAGEPDYEPIPSSREDEWLTEFRMSLGDALNVARRVAPTLTINGRTVADVMTDG